MSYSFYDAALGYYEAKRAARQEARREQVLEFSREFVRAVWEVHYAMELPTPRSARGLSREDWIERQAELVAECVEDV